MVRISKLQQAQEIYDMYTTLQRDWKDMHADMVKFGQLYFLDHWADEGGAKEGEERVTLPTHMNTVDMAHSLLISQQRKIHVVSQNQTTEAERLSSEIEKFLMGVFYVNAVRSGEDVINQALWNALVKKMGVIRLRWDERLAQPNVPEMPYIPPLVPPTQYSTPEEWMAQQPPMPAPTLQCKELPIVLENVAPENVFVKWGGRRGILYLFYGAKRTVEDIEAELGERLRIEPYRDMSWQDKHTTKVDFVEYWGWEYNGEKKTDELKRATLIDDKFLPNHGLQTVEGYTTIPYLILPAYRTPQEQPHFKLRSILEPLRDLVHFQEQDLTKLRRILKMFAVMPLVVQRGFGPPIEISTTLGDVIQLSGGQSVGFPVWPGTPPDFFRFLSIAEDKIQESGFPSVSFGRGMSGVSGYAITQYNEGARLKLDIPRVNLELFLTQLCQQIVTLCGSFAPNVAIPVWGEWKNQRFFTSLTGADMKGHVIQVEISSDLPGDELRNAAIGGQLKAQGALSLRTLMEKYLNIEQPEDELQRILTEQAAQHPVVKLNSIIRALAEDEDPLMRVALAQIIKALTSMKLAEVAQEGAQAGGGGIPQPQPTMMPPTAGPPVAQGQVLRQQVGLPPTETEGML